VPLVHALFLVFNVLLCTPVLTLKLDVETGLAEQHQILIPVLWRILAQLVLSDVTTPALAVVCVPQIFLSARFQWSQVVLQTFHLSALLVNVLWAIALVLPFLAPLDVIRG